MADNKVVRRKVSVENARIVFRNFEGKEGQFNAKGRRNFCLLLPPDIAEELKLEGWNVKELDPRDPQDDKQPYIKINVRYDKVPPKIEVITTKGKAVLSEGNVKILDWAEIESVDLTFTPYNWSSPNGSGITAYLKSMYVTLAEDEFEKKYRNVPDSAAAAILSEDED